MTIEQLTERVEVLENQVMIHEKILLVLLSERNDCLLENVETIPQFAEVLAQRADLLGD